MIHYRDAAFSTYKIKALNFYTLSKIFINLSARYIHRHRIGRVKLDTCVTIEKWKLVVLLIIILSRVKYLYLLPLLLICPLKYL